VLLAALSTEIICTPSHFVDGSRRTLVYYETLYCENTISPLLTCGPCRRVMEIQKGGPARDREAGRLGEGPVSVPYVPWGFGSGY
jgi:hypothetical protein